MVCRWKDAEVLAQKERERVCVTVWELRSWPGTGSNVKMSVRGQYQKVAVVGGLVGFTVLVWGVFGHWEISEG